jgi:hypothetical protein
MTDVSSYQNVNWSSLNNFNDFLTNVNNSGAGYLFTGIDILVFLVLLISLTSVYGWEAGMLSAGFISVILSILFVYMGVMNIWVASFFVGTIIIFIMYIIWSNRYD